MKLRCVRESDESSVRGAMCGSGGKGGTQLRLIANNLGDSQIEFTEIKSFHASGDKKAGHLKDYQ